MEIHHDRSMRGAPRCRVLLWLLWLVLVFSQMACDASDQYVIWPTSARTGESVAILFNTEWDTGQAPDGALLDASVDNVVIQLSDSTGFSQSISPRAVLEVPAALGSGAVRAAGFESWTGLVAIFDIPDPWPNGGLVFPDIFDVVVDENGIPTFASNQLTILGSGGTPLALSTQTPFLGLELQPMLRLRPAWNPTTAAGFDPIWLIGGLEFTLRYSPMGPGDVFDLAVLGNGEATTGLATITPLAPQSGDKLWRIVLIHPGGFSLPSTGCVASECYSGRWSLLDLPLLTDTTGLVPGDPIFVPSDFSIEDLRVVDSDGQQLNTVSNGQSYFNLFATNNRVMPVPEPGVAWLLGTGCLGLGVLKRRKRPERPRARAQPEGGPRARQGETISREKRHDVALRG